MKRVRAADLDSIRTRIARAEYVVDEQAVADAILQRTRDGRAALIDPLPRAMLESARVDQAPAA